MKCSGLFLSKSRKSLLQKTASVFLGSEAFLSGPFNTDVGSFQKKKPKIAFFTAAHFADFSTTYKVQLNYMQ